MTSANKRGQRNIKLSVSSEYDPLKVVLVHRPGKEIDRLTPSNKSQLLFEDIPYLRRMQREHDAFVKKLREAASGIRVLYFRDLLRELIVSDEAMKRRLVLSCCREGLYPGLASALLEHYSDDEIADLLIEGVTAREHMKRTTFEIVPRVLVDRKGRPIAPVDESTADPFLISPLPNMYFMRDPGLVVGSGFISTKMHFDARVRESYLVREVVKRHPLFEGSSKWYGYLRDEDRPFTIEGGDVIIINAQAIAVGASQRTRPETIRRLAQKLFEQQVVQRVYEIPIPSARAYMHLDTVFTIIGDGIIVTYPNVMNEVVGVRRYEPTWGESDEIHTVQIEERRSFRKILADEFGKHDIEPIETGGGNERDAAREQASDGTNVFAVSEGVVVTYDRNVKTNRALKDAGATVLQFDGSELVRGLGGPRCMTMPLLRER